MRFSRVNKSMRFAAVLLSFAVACGGGNKKKDTTPTNSGGSGQSMNDKDPVGGGGTTGGSGTTGGGTDPIGGGGGTTGDGSTPPITPPNFDTDPAQAKAQVDAHLTIAKQALSQATPDADKALAEARAALAIDAANVEAASYVAFAYYHKKLYDTAELVLDDLFKRESAKQNANVYYVYGLVYDHTNRPDRALLAYQKAVELNPSHASALVNLGVHQLKNSQYAEAQATFERLTSGQFNRTDAITLTSLGSAYRGRSAEFRPGAPQRDQFVRTAEQAYKRALQANSSYGPAYYNLGLLYLDTDPYPGIADPLQRLTASKAFFDQYKNMPGVDIKLYDARMKDVDKIVKRIQKQQKKKKTS
jgi:tetratricopeptide (TPR) repeat protein